MWTSTYYFSSKNAVSELLYGRIYGRHDVTENSASVFLFCKLLVWMMSPPIVWFSPICVLSKILLWRQILPKIFYIFCKYKLIFILFFNQTLFHHMCTKPNIFFFNISSHIYTVWIVLEYSYMILYISFAEELETFMILLVIAE